MSLSFLIGEPWVRLFVNKIQYINIQVSRLDIQNLTNAV